MITWKNQISQKLKKIDGTILSPIEVNTNIEALFDSLEAHPELGKLYSQSVGGNEWFSLKNHTMLVISQYLNYFYKRDLPKALPKSVFLLTLALHDIGKPIAIEKGNRGLQHHFTNKVINQIKDHLPFEVKDILAIVDGDPLGKYFTGTSLEEVILEIIQMSDRSSLSLKDFFHLLVVYYQVDVGSYLLLKEGKEIFSNIFRSNVSFNSKKQRLWFSSKHEKMFNILESSLFGKDLVI